MKHRLGNFRVHVRGRGLPKPTELVSGVHFNLDEAQISESLFLALNPLEYDLVHLGLAIYAVDRLFRKAGVGNDRPGFRDLEVTVEVSSPAFWNSQSSLIERILSFLSDDDWKIGFIAGGVPLSLPPFLFEPSAERSRICLYSGGLDSAAGLAIRLAECLDSFISVTAIHQPQQARRVRRHVNRFNRRFGARVNTVTSKTALKNPPRMDQQELSQRCRSFLFCGLAGAVASMRRVSEIEIYENGIGSLNLPPMTGMLWGGRATRGCHPHFLRMMSELVTGVAGRRVAFVLPFKNLTKGELVGRLAAIGLADLVPDTVSCVHYPLRSPGPKQCGLCPGCLGTRQALAIAGLPVEISGYGHDILHSTCNALPASSLAFLREQVLQVSDLQELTPDGQKPEILRRHLASSHAVTIADSADRWVDLLGRYRDEWMRVIYQGQQKGCRWASWIDRRDAGCGDKRNGGSDNERLKKLRFEELQRTPCPVS